MKTIEYKGKKIKTNRWKEMPQELFEDVKREFYKKPTKEQVRENVRKMMLDGNITMKYINDYFLKEIMSDVVLYNAKWSLNEMFEHKPIMEIFYYAIHQNENTFTEDLSLYQKIVKAFQIGGAGVVKQPTNFKIKTVVDILKKYNINNKYVDTSCGWGVRMVGSLLCGIDYYGIDPNYKLTEKLNEIADLFFEVDLFSPTVTIKTQGSETYIKEWKNKMGVAFTSPPYFALEDYKVGEQSIKNFSNYETWLEQFLLPTIKNTYEYLIDGGHMLINIKNYKNFDLEKQTIKLAKQVGFEYVGNENFENISRINNDGKLIENNEKIFVFKKNNT